MSNPEDIQAERAALDAMPSGDPSRASQLSKLGFYVYARYKRTGSMSDIDEAIRLLKEAVQLTPKNDPNRAQRLVNLCVYWYRKYPMSETQDVHDLEDAIGATRDAVAAVSDTFPNRWVLLNQLGTQLGLLYLRTRELGVIEENIKIQREAINVIPESNPNRIMYYFNLASPLSARFEATGAIADLDEALNICRVVVEQTDDGNPKRLDRERSTQLGNYASMLGDRYLRTGAMADLQEAITIQQTVCDRVQDDDEYIDRATCLGNLGIHLSRRYRRIGTVTDLINAIKVGRQACNMTPDGHAFRARYLSNLAILLKHEYFRRDDLKDLEEAVRVQREAVKAARKGHPDVVASLHNLGGLLITQHKSTGQMADLEEGLQIGRQVVGLTPENHSNRGTFLSTLAVQLGTKYSRTALIADIDEAIRFGEEALNATAESHPERANRLANQGQRYGDRFWKTKTTSDLNSAISYYRSALYGPGVFDITRIRAGREVLQYFAAIPDWTRAFDAAKTAMDLVPKLISQTINNADKQDVLAQVYGLSSDAGAVALSAGKGALAALNFLEQGRGMVASSIEEIRSESLDLETKHPKLAECFHQLRSELGSSLGPEIPPAARISLASEVAAEAKDLDELVNEIRKEPGFEDFMGVPSESKIKGAALYGPIVVVNISSFRSDAILIDTNQVWSVNLAQLKIQDVKVKIEKGTGSPEVLEWLWEVIAEPVLDALGISQSSSDERLPRIWWIPIGLLSVFPLHAAGRHYKGSSESVIDRAMSSYSSSIKAIIRSRGRPSLETIPPSPERAVLVSMEHTPRHSRLPFAIKETAALRQLLKSKGFDPIQPKPCKEDVVSQLSQSKIFHFAGHGSTNGRDPSQSCLLLEDWEKNPLTVSTLLDVNIQQYSPFLAYLSACGTGQITYEKFLDESIHLVSAFQLAGFRHVVGTLWEVGDEISVDMAKIAYEEIRRGEMADESVCRGLHKATRQLRDRWIQERAEIRGRKRKIREVTLLNDSGVEAPRDAVYVEEDESADLPQWVPYVHYGV
ncbi:CHAT domain-containing protein [Dactylonectria estremocensis]|uniref:CHAT domain-containing protein n=1 Tax=Dactylonectria estremocensis TaxID=1079267 RepID=A0A9P9E4N7_9HYPO|nr:CHAT domain-containing protein [Dactylonectria estremocensis]